MCQKLKSYIGMTKWKKFLMTNYTTLTQILCAELRLESEPYYEKLTFALKKARYVVNCSTDEERWTESTNWRSLPVLSVDLI